MEEKQKDNQHISLINQAKSIVIILPPDPSPDMVTASLTLFSSLSSSQKTVQIGCGSPVFLNQPLAGYTHIDDSIGSRNLVVSFDYKEEYLDKVEYDIRDDGRFYLSIKPKTDAPVPSTESVSFSYQGASADLVITLGITTLEELGKIYAEEKAFLDDASILSLNISLQPTAFASTEYHQPASCFCELIASICQTLDHNIEPEFSNALLDHIYRATDSLTNRRVTPNTFLTIAHLMKQGGFLPKRQPSLTSTEQAPFFEMPADEESIPLPTEEDYQVPSDWQKPKIYRVGNKTLKSKQ